MKREYRQITSLTDIKMILQTGVSVYLLVYSRYDVLSPIALSDFRKAYAEGNYPQTFADGELRAGGISDLLPIRTLPQVIHLRWSTPPPGIQSRFIFRNSYKTSDLRDWLEQSSRN
jgi:hypothetical protein